jgi:hypothetical protein
MSSRFLPKSATPDHEDLVPLMVHPDDRDRLQALSGIWPVADTLNRMIDVFIATGAAQSAASVHSAPTPAPSPAGKPVAPTAVDDEISKKSPPRAEAKKIRTDKAKPESAETRSRPASKPAHKASSKTGTGNAPKSDPELLAFTRGDYPDLKFTRLTGYMIGEVSKQDEGLNWSALFEEAVGQAIAAGHGPSDLDQIGVRLREGKHSEKGFRWCEKLNRSVQISTSNYMFTRILRIADLLNVPVRVGVSWHNVAGAAHPGKAGLISAKPMRRPVAAPESAPKTAKRVRDASTARFPAVGSMVSYVYLDRPDDEKVSYIVDGPADAEAGQVSRTSPLGFALLETPCGSVTAIDVKGTKRKVRVLEVVGD